MRKTLKYILMAMAAALALPSCLVHEFPEGNRDVDVAVNLDFKYPMTPFKTVTKAGPRYVVRYTLNAYEFSGVAYDRHPKYTATFYREDPSSMDNTLHINLPAGKYKLQVWADFVAADREDTFWVPSDFTHVSIAGTYLGSSDYRDAFAGEVDADVSDIRASGMSALVVMPMHRPLAKYRLVATDKQEFLTKLVKSLGYDDTKADETKAGYDFSRFTARVEYMQFFPSQHNMFSDRPVNSATGVSYTSNLVEQENEEIEIAFDYVLAEDETQVTLAVTLFDALSENLGTIRGITVPLKRGGITTVTGSFLTKGSVSGVSIDPSFDGEHNITF